MSYYFWSQNSPKQSCNLTDDLILGPKLNRIEELELWEGNFADPVNLIRHFEFFMKVDPEVLCCISKVHLSSVQGSPRDFSLYHIRAGD